MFEDGIKDNEELAHGGGEPPTGLFCTCPNYAPFSRFRMLR
jgi:hypothetical protein